MKRDVPALWLCLLSPEALERLEQQGRIEVPHPDFPEPLQEFFYCPNCRYVHHRTVRVALECRRGKVSLVYYARDGDDQSEVYLNREYVTHLPPSVASDKLRAHIEAGELTYLREVKETGEDPYGFISTREARPHHLKLLANAELMSRLQPEAIRA